MGLSSGLVSSFVLLRDWKHISHVPADDVGRLAGLVSYRALLHILAGDRRSMMVRDVMDPNPATIGPDASVQEAIRRMDESKTDCLPVIARERLVGIITSHDVLRVCAAAISRAG